MPQLILLRHGQSQWNLENRFTGWVDVELSEQGEAEARAAGEKLAPLGIDIVFTSVLRRAMRTAELALAMAGKHNLPTERDQALNERHYGDLQGLNKAETAQKFGDEQVHIWRRSYDVPPPNGESLKDTQFRTMPYFHGRIIPELRAGKNVLIAAHGNSLRSIVMTLDLLSVAEVLELNIPTGAPLLYNLTDDLRITDRYYL